MQNQKTCIPNSLETLEKKRLKCKNFIYNGPFSTQKAEI